MLDEPEARVLVVYDPGMKLIMNDNNLTKLGDVLAFLEGTLLIEFKVDSQSECYPWITGTLIRFGYGQLKKEQATGERKRVVW